VKKNYRMQRTCWLTDVVPTICYLNHWPVPADTEGAVIYQALSNPDIFAPAGPSSGPALEGAGKGGEQDGKQVEDKPGETGEDKGGPPGGQGAGDSEKKKKMNERLKKLGYDLPF
jgi:hypothetical protein